MKNVFGSGPPIHKQIKTAIQEGNEDKATALFLSKDGSKLHPSRPLPTKKLPSSEDTAMHFASRYAMAKLFKVFLEYNGNPGILNARKENCGHTACQMASFPYKRAEILELIYSWRGKTEENLVDFVDVDQVDVDGNTALHLAAASNLLPCIEKLVQFGADLGIANLENLTCSDLADRAGHYSVATMLEIGKIFTPADEAKEATQNYRKFTTAIADAKLVPECHSVNLMGLVQFMDKAVMTTAQVLNETAARSEVLLNTYGWDFKRLKRDFEHNPSHVFTIANIKPRVLALSDGKKTDIHVGIPIEEMYFDPNYANVGQFTIFQEGHCQQISETSHVKPKKTDPCPLCGKVMLEAANLQHFLTGTLVEPLSREVYCSSGHKFCFSCWSDYTISQLKREHSAGCLPCPSVGCGEVLDLQWAHIILRKKPDLKNRLYAQRQKHVSESLNLYLCPHPECELWVSVKHPDENILPGSHDESALDAVQRPSKAAICGNGHAFCLECHHEAHTPCTCIQLFTWNNMLKEEASRTHNHEEEHILVNVLHYPRTKKCPKCQANISKVTSGCNIVTCSNCRCEVCFLCLEEWSTHGIHHGEIMFCNVFANGQLDSPAATLKSISDKDKGGVFEEKVDDFAYLNHKQKLLKTTRFAHYATRFISHEQSWLVERESKLGTIQRVLEALKLSHTRQLRWLQNEVMNPYDEIEIEQEEAKIMKNLEEADVSLESFYLPHSPAIAFLEQAFDELERARTFLRWSYPFVLLELEERFLAAIIHAQKTGTAVQQQGGVTGAGRGGAQSSQSIHNNATTAMVPRAKLEELKTDYFTLQSALEYYTEMLSFYISQPRIRATKQQIEDMTRKVKRKRIEMERFICEYYITRKLDQNVAVVDVNNNPALPSANSSLTSSSSLKEDTPKQPVATPALELHIEDDDEEEEEESDDDDDDEQEDYDVPIKASPNIRTKQPAQQSVQQQESKTTSNRAYYRITTEETQSATAVEQEERSVDHYQASTIMHQKRQEEYEYEQQQLREYERLQQELQYRQQQELEYRQQQQQLEYERQQQQEYERQQRLLQQQQKQQQQQQQKRIVTQREPPPLPPPPPPQPIIEQRVIGAKKDPDQEALEHAILISKQEDEFGVNMYDALRDEDEPLVEEYMAQGFTREEAILIIFEETFGKVSIQTSRITPAMPTLHKVDSTFGAPLAALQVSEEDEPEVEYYMTKGFTREQAIEVMFANRKKAEDERASEEEARRHEAELIAAEAARTTARRQSAVQRVGSVTNYTEDNYYSSNQSVGNMSNSYGNTTQEIYDSNSGNIDDYELQDMLAQGLTREQAMAILMAQQRTTASRFAASNGDDRSVARSNRSYTGRSVQTRSVISEPQQLQQGSVYDDGFLDNIDGVVEDEEDDDDFLEDDPEVSYLMQSGYTREQAIHQIELGRSGRGGVGGSGAGGRQSTGSGGRSSSAAVMQPPAPARNVENPEVQRYLNQGYTREQATQMALQGFSTNSSAQQGQQQSFRQQQQASVQQSAVVFQPPVANTNQPVFRGASSFVQGSNGGGGGGNSMYGSSYAASNTSRGGYGLGSQSQQGGGGSGAYSDYNQSDMQSSTYYEASIAANNMGLLSGGSNYPQPPPPRGDRGMRREDLEMERVMLISQQESEFGTNMYEILTPANGPEIDEMLSMGYTEDEAVQWIFDRRYRYGVTAQAPMQQQQQQPQQRPQSMMMMQAQPAPAPQQQPMYYQQPPQLQQVQQQRPQLATQHSQQAFYAPQQQISPQPNYSPQPQYSPQPNYNNNNGNSMYQSFNNGSMYGSNDRNSIPRQSNSRPGSVYGDAYASRDSGDRRHSSQHSSSQDNSPVKKKVFRGASILGLGGSGSGNASKVKASDLKRLEKMGFDRDRAIRALLAHNNDVNEAAAALSGAF